MVFKGKALWIRTTCLGSHPPALWTESRFLLLLQKRQPVVNQLSRIRSLVKLQPSKTLDSPSKSSISPNMPEVLDLSAASPLWPYSSISPTWPEVASWNQEDAKSYIPDIFMKPDFTLFYFRSPRGKFDSCQTNNFHWSPVFSRKQSKSET